MVNLPLLMPEMSTPLRVNFDAQIFGAQTYGGISRQFASLARELALLPGCEPRILAPWHRNAYLESLPPELVRGRRVGNTFLPQHLLRACSLLGSKLMHATSRGHILHQTYYYPFFQLPTATKKVLTVFDMIQERFPQHLPPNDPIVQWKKRALLEADHIICISHQTRDDLLQAHGDAIRVPVSVTHLGFDALNEKALQQGESAFRTETFGADVPYLLYVGTRGRHKNFAAVLQAYGNSRQLHTGFRLLCFGGGPFSTEEKHLIAHAGVHDRVFQRGGDDAVLAACYRHAALFVYPSLYEGFGIPPLEAMSLNCPVACSRISSIPEVVGDAGAYFDPLDVDGIQDTLERVLDSSAQRAELVQRGKARAAAFSWHKCAVETAAIYQECLRG